MFRKSLLVSALALVGMMVVADAAQAQLFGRRGARAWNNTIGDATGVYANPWTGGIDIGGSGYYGWSATRFLVHRKW